MMLTKQKSSTISKYNQASSTLFLDTWVYGKSKATERLYRMVGQKFLLFVGKPIEGVTLRYAQLFLSSLGNLTPNTLKTYTGVIKSLLTFAFKMNLTKVNIGELLKMPKSRDAINERILTKGQVKDVITQEPKQRNQLIIKTLYLLGLRNTELCRLKWSDITLKPNGDGTLTVFGKGDKARFLIIPKQLLNELLELKTEKTPFIFVSQKGGPLDPRSTHRIVADACRRVGIEHASPHWFRHTHATHALENKADINLLSKSLGHSCVAVTSRYLHSNPEDCSSLYVTFDNP